MSGEGSDWSNSNLNSAGLDALFARHRRASLPSHVQAAAKPVHSFVTDTARVRRRAIATAANLLARYAFNVPPGDQLLLIWLEPGERFGEEPLFLVVNRLAARRSGWIWPRIVQTQRLRGTSTSLLSDFAPSDFVERAVKDFTEPVLAMLFGGAGNDPMTDFFHGCQDGPLHEIGSTLSSCELVPAESPGDEKQVGPERLQGAFQGFSFGGCYWLTRRHETARQKKTADLVPAQSCLGNRRTTADAKSRLLQNKSRHARLFQVDAIEVARS